MLHDGEEVNLARRPVLRGRSNRFLPGTTVAMDEP
jgi:hypothetical protein